MGNWAISSVLVLDGLVLWPANIRHLLVLPARLAARTCERIGTIAGAPTEARTGAFGGVYDRAEPPIIPRSRRMHMRTPLAHWSVFRAAVVIALAVVADGIARRSAGQVPATASVKDGNDGAETPVFAPVRESGVVTPLARTRPRQISSRVAAELTSLLPPVAPVQPKVPTSTSVPENASTEGRQDSEGIVRMPRYIVRDKQVPVPSEEKVLTNRGVADIAMKRYLSETYRALNPFTLPLFGMSPEARATAMYREDERLRRIEDLKDQVRMMNLTDRAAGRKIKRESDLLLMRDPQFHR